MKKIYLLIAVFFSLVSFGQDTDQNYSKKVSYKQPTTTSVSNPDITVAKVEVTYYDGLGRPIQQIAHKQSNSGNDIITHMEYDSFGRQTKEYLPYPTSAPSLGYNDIMSVASDLNSFYSSYNGGTSNPFSEKEIEASPLDRIFKQAAPGDDWALGLGKEIKFDYKSNESNEVKHFSVETSWNTTLGRYDIQIVEGENYLPNKLYKTITKDENWVSGKNHTTEEFKNKEGQVVLKRTYADIGSTSEVKHDTYYVYDDYGNLTYVIPPLAPSVGLTQTVLDELCYQYIYDYRNRLIEKKLPGKDWEYIVYNAQNMVVATGPVYNPWGENYPTEKGWLITKYDVFGRVVYTGYYFGRLVSETERANYQNQQTGLTEFAEEVNSPSFIYDDILLGYTNEVEPTRFYRVLSINYYDNYSNPYAPTTLPSDVLGQNLAEYVRALPTGNWTRVLDNSSNTTAEISYTIYDDKYRPIRTHTSNYLGGYTQVDTNLDWSGKVLETHTFHKYDAMTAEIQVIDRFTYSPQDRLTIQTQEVVGHHTEELIVKNTYDELGQLISKNVGGEDTTGALGLQKVDYSYNIRGWLKKINNINDIISENDLFAFDISYNDPDTATPLFNGNISETQWITNSDGVLRKYNYTYDQLNRLLRADYGRPDTGTIPNNYLEELTYDKNGNILTLNRHGDRDSDGLVPLQEIDNLVYTYHPDKKNQLMKVFDSTNLSLGFKDDSDGVTDATDDYSYDGNGNMISDENKGITSILYNHLNLPISVEFVGTAKSISYLYNANGQKINKTINSGAPLYTITNTDYMQGGFQYKGSDLQFFPHPEGYVNITDNKGINSFNYVYNYTDHLGNIRLSYGYDPDTETLKIIEENHYYPFGLKHTNYNSDQLLYMKTSSGGTALRRPAPTTPVEPSYKYKYNGFEYQDELGLNMYDYGARNYDPALGRWMNVDPLAETSRRFSPYAYALNNPLVFIDPDGMQADWIRNVGEGGSITYTAEEGDSAWSLYQQHGKTDGFSASQANEMVEAQLGENYTGEDGQLKSNVEVGDAVTVYSDVQSSPAKESSEGNATKNSEGNDSKMTKADVILTITGDKAFADNMNYALNELGARSVGEAGIYALWREKSQSGGIIWDAGGVDDILDGVKGSAKSTRRATKANVKTSKTKPSTSKTVTVSGVAKEVKTGPRGGKYYINKAGKKTYLNRDGTKRK